MRHISTATQVNGKAYKSSAVAEVGDRLTTIDMGRKVGRGLLYSHLPKKGTEPCGPCKHADHYLVMVAL